MDELNTNLTEEDRADLARILRDVIDADRYPFSPKVRRLKELLEKIDPEPKPDVTPHPPPRPAGVPVRHQGFCDNELDKIREALAHRCGEVRRPAAGAASGG